jgi:hypothetical protein
VNESLDEQRAEERNKPRLALATFALQLDAFEARLKIQNYGGITVTVHLIDLPTCAEFISIKCTVTVICNLIKCTVTVIS